MQFFSLDWYEFHRYVSRLAEMIEKENDYDLIVAVARGGLTISHILSDFLKLPITTFTISSYRDLQQQETVEVTFKIGNRLHDKKILLVDDISDTGKTFERGIKYLKDIGARTIRTASLFTKPWTKFTPDYYVEEIDKWIIFPYEGRETVEGLVKKFSQEGKTAAEIRQALKKLKLTDYYIGKFIK